MKLLEEPFELIKSGKKTIEIRLFDDKRQKINVGDTIEFSKSSIDKVEVEVIALLKYKTFKDLINNFPMQNYGYPKDYPVQEFLNKIYTIYSKEQEKQFGVLGIKVRLI